MLEKLRWLLSLGEMKTLNEDLEWNIITWMSIPTIKMVCFLFSFKYYLQ